MVAYSFKPRFVPAIKARTKCQTIRGERARHAKPGERLQLFTGMRTKQCEKIIDDPLCQRVSAILMTWEANNFTRICVVPDHLFDIVGFDEDYDLPTYRYDVFAQREGFAGAREMLEFWQLAHGSICEQFKGVLISWQGDTP